MYKFSVFSRQYSDRSKKSVNCKLPTANSQQGFAPIAVLVVLVLGVTLGTYLTMQPTNFLPFADNGETDSDDGSSGFDGGSNESYDYSDSGNPGGFEDAGTDLDGDGQTADVDNDDANPNDGGYGGQSNDNNDGVTNDGASFENQSDETRGAFEDAYGAGAAAAWANAHDREVETGHTADGRSINQETGKPEDAGGGNNAAVADAQADVGRAQSALNSAIESGRSASDIQAGYANLEAALESLGTIQGWGAGMEVERSSTVANSLDFGQIVDGTFQENGLNFNPSTGAWGVVGESGQYSTFDPVTGDIYTSYSTYDPVTGETSFGVHHYQREGGIELGADSRAAVASTVAGAMADARTDPEAKAEAAIQGSMAITGDPAVSAQHGFNSYVGAQAAAQGLNYGTMTPQEQAAFAGQYHQSFAGISAGWQGPVESPPTTTTPPGEAVTAPSGGGAPATTGSTGATTGASSSSSTAGISGSTPASLTGDDGKFQTYNASSPITSGQYAGGHVQITSTYDPGQAGFAANWDTTVVVADKNGTPVATGNITDTGIAMSAGQSLNSSQVSQALNGAGIDASTVHGAPSGSVPGNSIPSGGSPSEVTGNNALPPGTTGTLQDVGGSASVGTRGNQGTKSNK